VPFGDHHKKDFIARQHELLLLNIGGKDIVFDYLPVNNESSLIMIYISLHCLLANRQIAEHPSVVLAFLIHHDRWHINGARLANELTIWANPPLGNILSFNGFLLLSECWRVNIVFLRL
jgi:hypothetical protein